MYHFLFPSKYFRAYYIVCKLEGIESDLIINIQIQGMKLISFCLDIIYIYYSKSYFKYLTHNHTIFPEPPKRATCSQAGKQGAPTTVQHVLKLTCYFLFVNIEWVTT